MARILVVDDEKSLRNTLTEFLLREGHEAEAAADAETALTILARERYDVVVSDIVLPGTSGLELAKRIRELDSLAQVILMTGVPSVESAAHAVRSGVFDYLLKPVNRSAIVRVVGNAARLRAVQEERARLFEENQRYQAELERLVRERTAALEAEIAERMRTEDALRRAVERVEGLQKIDRAILRADSPDRIIFRAIRHLRRMLGCPAVAVAVFEESGNAVNVVRSCKENGETQLFSLRVPRADFPVPQEIAAKAAYQASEPPGEAAPWEGILLGQGLRVWLTLPLLAEGSVLGLLAVGRNGHVSPGAEAADVAREAADQLSIGLFQARLREKVRAHAEHLERKVAERTADLARANRELQAASQAKSEFLASMSHELRTPLNSILGFSQLLLEHEADLPVERRRRYLANIHTSGEHLLALINDILDISKVEAGKLVLRLEPLPIQQTLEDLLVIARGLALKKQQRLELTLEPGLPPLQADPVRFKQIVFNLLSNAVKFTPPGGTITVAARAVPVNAECGVGSAECPSQGSGPESAFSVPKSASLEIAVTDTGVGIRAEDMPKLFREFVQLEATRHITQEGTGLGLALTRRLVELHGGSIRAESKGEGQGSTFRVVLPNAEPGMPHTPAFGRGNAPCGKETHHAC